MKQFKENKNRKMNGIFVFLLIMAVLISGCSLGSRHSEQAKIDTKMGVISSYIDKYFLDDVDQSNIEEYIYKGMMAGLEDPYAAYYTKDEYEEVQRSNNGVYSGIGVLVSQNITTMEITIVKVFKGGPAADAGVLPGDRIVKVNGEDCTSSDVSDVVAKMKGKEGTTVEVTFYRSDESKNLDFTLERRDVEVPTVEFQMLPDQIGYIAVSEFDEVTANQFSDAIWALEKDGMKSLIIDMRNNPGGLVNVAVKMLDQILPNELFVYTEDKNGKRFEYKGTDNQELNLPMAVLINGNSASASEIFAGAIKDYEAGTLVGMKSYGKGIVQQIFPLDDGSALKLTTAKYFTPKGNNIHKIGIEPDVEIDLTAKQKKQAVIPIDEDVQVQKAVSVLKKQSN